MGHEKGDLIVGCGGPRLTLSQRRQHIYWLKRDKGDLFGDYMFSVLYMTDRNIKYYVDKILELKPAILRGYPSFYDSLAQYILNNNIKIDFEIKGINLTSETCSSFQRKNIERAFSSKVYFEYGHNEICLYCYTKDRNFTYKSSPIYGYLEVLNDDGSDTEPDEIGNIVATGFNNLGMPFIRYNTEDLGEVSYRNGGIVHFKHIHGRTSDFILSKQNQRVYLTSLRFGSFLKAFSRISKWQIIQNRIGHIEMHIIRKKDYSIEDELEITEEIKSTTDVDIEYKYVKNIPKTSRGKHILFIQNVEDVSHELVCVT